MSVSDMLQEQDFSHIHLFNPVVNSEDMKKITVGVNLSWRL